MKRTGYKFIKLTAAALCLTALLFSCTPARAESGADYTGDAALAKKLDEIFTGEAKLFSNTDQGYPLDSFIGSGRFYVDGDFYGSECWIYANAVYYYLFGEIPNKGKDSYRYSFTALKGCKKLDCATLAAAGVGTGTYLRTTDRKDAAYSSSAGHSLIVLGYDEDGLTWLDANWGTPKYYVHLHTKDWEYVNKYVMRSGYVVSHAVIPYRTASSGILCDGAGKEYLLGGMGITRVVTVPDGIVKIGEEAFEPTDGCAVIVPGSVTELEPGALGKAAVFAPENSAAQAYAQANGLKYYPLYDGWELLRAAN